MNKNSLVSIITPSYNSAKFISQTIDSVLAQTYQNWEMIIVDDVSKDNSVEIIEEYIKKDLRIKLIKLQKNSGAAMARNKALDEAVGKYIAFLDSDDLWLPNKLEKQLEFMQKNSFAFTFTAYTPMSENGNEDFSTIYVPKSLSYIQYCKNTIIGCLTVMIDREQTGKFHMPNIRSSHDMALWLQIMKRGFLAHGLNEVLSKYRVVSTSNTSKKYKAALEVWDVYRKVEKLSLIRSAWYFVNYAFNAVKKRA